MATLQLRRIQPVAISFSIKGTSPLIQHAWSEKALRMLRLTAAERKKLPKTARDPETEAMEAAYRTTDGEFGIRVVAIKAAIVEAAHKDYGIEKTTVRKALFVTDPDGSGCVPLRYESLNIREDLVKVGMNQTDIRYRPQFTGWGCQVTMQIDRELLTLQNVIDLVNRAGFSCGIGEWRPQRGGEFGRFEFDDTQPVQESAQTEREAA